MLRRWSGAFQRCPSQRPSGPSERPRGYRGLRKRGLRPARSAARGLQWKMPVWADVARTNRRPRHAQFAACGRSVHGAAAGHRLGLGVGSEPRGPVTGPASSAGPALASPGLSPAVRSRRDKDREEFEERWLNLCPGDPRRAPLAKLMCDRPAEAGGQGALAEMRRCRSGQRAPRGDQQPAASLPTPASNRRAREP